MPRPSRCRRIERLPVYRSFSPDDAAADESVYMTVDEFETFRLLDNEGLTQEECAVRMNIARTTVTAIYDSARKKVADALVNGKRMWKTERSRRNRSLTPTAADTALWRDSCRRRMLTR